MKLKSLPEIGLTLPSGISTTAEEVINSTFVDDQEKVLLVCTSTNRQIIWIMNSDWEYDYSCTSYKDWKCNAKFSKLQKGLFFNEIFWKKIDLDEIYSEKDKENCHIKEIK